MANPNCQAQSCPNRCCTIQGQCVNALAPASTVNQCFYYYDQRTGGDPGLLAALIVAGVLVLGVVAVVVGYLVWSGRRRREREGVGVGVGTPGTVQVPMLSDQRLQSNVNQGHHMYNPNPQTYPSYIPNQYIPNPQHPTNPFHPTNPTPQPKNFYTTNPTIHSQEPPTHPHTNPNPKDFYSTSPTAKPPNNGPPNLETNSSSNKGTQQQLPLQSQIYTVSVNGVKQGQREREGPRAGPQGVGGMGQHSGQMSHQEFMKVLASNRKFVKGYGDQGDQEGKMDIEEYRAAWKQIRDVTYG